MVLALGLFGYGATASAGTRDTTDWLVNVTVSTGSPGNAAGAMGSVRNSSDSEQYIGCTVYAYPGGPATVNCFARSRDPNYGFCTSTDVALVQTAASITSDSVIHFGWDAQGKCSVLEIDTGSLYAPKLP
jgi:hypothetical protein